MGTVERIIYIVVIAVALAAAYQLGYKKGKKSR